MLTERQCEVLSLAASGLSDGEIGQCLYISPFTVQAHLRNIRERLRARNTVHAVAIALVRGLIQFDPASAIEPM